MTSLEELLFTDTHTNLAVMSAIIELVKRIVITLFYEGKDIDYWSPSSFHNGPPTIKVIKSIDYLINYQYNLPTKIT